MSANSLKMDKHQLALHENFPSNHYLSDAGRVARLMEWITFYRRNLHRFVEHYLSLKLHLYQQIILYLMNLHPTFCMVASRATAKSFIIAIFACAKAILYPHSQIVIASGTKAQAKLIVSEKIEHELMRDSPNLRGEIKKIVNNQSDALVLFHNGSSIKVVAADEQARGNRGTIMIYEEFRQIQKKVIDSILSPFLVIRQVPCLKRPEYESVKSLQEEPMEIYISSSWLRSHWMWDIMKLFMTQQLENDSASVVCMDYPITLRHNIRTRKQLVRERKKLDPMSWAIEYENVMVSQNSKAYFRYDDIHQNQKLVKAFYPRRHADFASKVKNKYAIPKLSGEIRIVSCDIAMVQGSANDNSVYSCIRLLPENSASAMLDDATGLRSASKHYRRQVPYLESMQGGHTEKQAIRIKQLFNDFDADYCVLDVLHAGVALYDSLAKVLYDSERDVEYAPWSCMNDETTAGRIQIAGALPIVFAVSASAKLNSEIAVAMRESLVGEKIDLLLNHNDAIEEIERRVPEYLEAADLDEQLFYERPFLETTALVGEMIALEYEVGDQSGAIRVKEPSGGRKDRYTSVSYGNYFAGLLERDLLFDQSDYQFVPLYN